MPVVLIMILFLIAWIVFYVKFQRIRCGNMVCITGGIKTGKTQLAVFLSRQLLCRQRVKVWLYNVIGRWFVLVFKHKKVPKKPRPLLYSNIPLKCDYVPITKELLTRKKTWVQGSVAYIGEASLVADSMCYKDAALNEDLLLFNKLFAHITHGGYCVYDTQSISDNHFAVKRCLNSYFYIHHQVKIPFFCIVYMKEERYSEDNHVMNEQEGNADEGYKVKVVPKSVWKLYDRYCYSTFTDSLPKVDKSVNGAKLKDLKARDIVSFKDYKTLGGDKK